MMALAQVVWRRAPWALSLASTRARPALRRAVGVGQVAMTSRTASCSSHGPRIFSRAGRGLGAHGPRMRLEVWFT
ncbi:hypothetical protein AXF14_06355 [Actinomyces radicidentis]|uniref:Uncharacterized protein n=1 Tax=Actinomyces radicidentis TaxID=111015 RepID=A0A0X8JEC1_ACTRD|nr:hypothetical protein AXF14_06355 [Actinomyces radicidentis]